MNDSILNVRFDPSVRFSTELCWKEKKQIEKSVLTRITFSLFRQKRKQKNHNVYFPIV